MKCSSCDKERATVHIINIAGEKFSDLHLCEDCARAQGYIFGPNEVSFEDVVHRLITDNAEAGSPVQKEAVYDKPCPNCGNTVKEILMNHSIHCEEDVTEFRKEIEVIIDTIHGTVRHTGKTHLPNTGDSRSQQMISVLERQLDQAVKAEDYERAALIRDKIRELR
jgi:protein arginine kinase activator